MRMIRTLLVTAIALAAGVVLVVQTMNARHDIGGTMRHHNLRSGVIIYGIQGEHPRIRRFASEKGKVYNFWSLSKPITAAAVFAAADRGLVDLNEKYAGASVADLLRHAGGWDRKLAGDPIHDLQEQERCIDMPIPPRQFEPGTKAEYSNVGYCALGRLIEGRFDQSYHDAVTAMIPEAIGMTYDDRLGPAGGWGGTAEQYFAFAQRDVPARALVRPSFASTGPYYALGWRVLGDGTLSHFGMLTGTANDQFTVVYKRGRWTAVGLFSGMPTNGEIARNDLLSAIRALPR
ncbi:hypothetical protein NT2_12_00140 [Caenibius tardaugens NBRC 16725]|uniref:Beta-lactamase-related domain-containing protein n=1 Tax=Caenibius tardaugens NBRC 16725 TaxID=1219035 RepID=U2YPA7_9SPHN|nr:hypothetical protein NT2_12_00140 [Caenibius tardaugens NBRC 16725]